MSVPGPPGPLVVLLAHRGGEELRHPLPPPRPRARRAPAGRRARRRGADPARRERGGRGVRVLRRRRRRGEPRPCAGSPTRADRTRRREVRAALPAARRRDLPDAAPEMVPDTGYGLAWSAGADVVFYVRMDEAQRPYQLWRHRLGTDPAGDELVYEEDGPALLARDRHDPRHRLRARSGCTARTPASGAPSPRASRSPTPAVVMARREGVEYRAGPPDAGGRRYRLVRRPHQRGRPWTSASSPHPTPSSGPARTALARGGPAPARACASRTSMRSPPRSC